MPDLTLGNYEIDEDGNGNLVIKDKNDTVVFQYDDASSTFQPQVEFDFGSNDISNVGSVSTDELFTTTAPSITDADPSDERIAVAKQTDVNGSLVWEFADPNGSVQSSPTVVDGVVYVGSDDNSLYAVDAVDRFARLYVADSQGWIPVYRGPNEQPQVAGSTLTGNYTAQTETNQ